MGNNNFINQLPKESSRLKLCWLSSSGIDTSTIIKKLDNDSIPVLNIGTSLAKTIDLSGSENELSFQVNEHLKKVLSNKASQIANYNLPILAIYNIGIVKEQQLHINFKNILQDVCRSTCIMLIWNGISKDGKFIQKTDVTSEVYLSFPQQPIEISI